MLRLLQSYKPLVTVIKYKMMKSNLMIDSQYSTYGIRCKAFKFKSKIKINFLECSKSNTTRNR